MKRILNNAISFFVVAIVLLLLIPLPPFALDMMIIFNLSISLVILLITMNIRNPLEFAIFPSLLLVTTLIRLGLNISSTRSILTKNGDAGKVIQLSTSRTKLRQWQESRYPMLTRQRRILSEAMKQNCHLPSITEQRSMISTAYWRSRSH